MERGSASENGSAADALMSLKNTPDAAGITHRAKTPDCAAEAQSATEPCNGTIAADILASLEASNNPHRQFDNDFLQLPHDRALSKETVFQILTQRMGPTAPCRASASPIDRRTRFFYVTSSKFPGSGRGPEDSSNDISVSFQSIANSEPWWSDHVHDGNRLGIVARHMSRRTRVQGKAAMDSPSALFAGNGNDFHGFQGRWFCLVQAPCHLIGDKQAKLKLAKAVPGAYSLVQVWRAPGSENANSQRGKRKYASPRAVTEEQGTSHLYRPQQQARLESGAALMTDNRAREERIGESDQPPLPPALQRPDVLTAPPLTQNMQLLARYPSANDLAFVSQSTAPTTAKELFRPRLEGRSYSQDRCLLAPSQLLPLHQQPVQPSNQTTHQGMGPSHTAARKQALRAPIRDNHHRAVSEFSRSCSGGGGGGGNSPWPHGTSGGNEGCESMGCSSGVGSSFGQVSPTSSSTLHGSMVVPPGALKAAAGIAVEGQVHPRIYTYSKADEEDSQESDSGEGAEELNEEKRIALSSSCLPSSPAPPPPPPPYPYSSPSSSSFTKTTETAVPAAAPSLQALPADDREESLMTSSANLHGVVKGATPLAAQPLLDATGLQKEVQSLTQIVSGLREQLSKEQGARKRVEQLVATHMVQLRLQQQQQQQQQHQRQHGDRAEREQQFLSSQSLLRQHQPQQHRQQEHQHQLQRQSMQLMLQQFWHQQQQQEQRQFSPYNYLVGAVQNTASTLPGARFSFF